MQLPVFRERVESLVRPEEMTLLIQGVTEDNNLLVASFEEGQRGMTTLVANTGANNNRIVTFDPTPDRTKQPDYREINVAAIAVQHLWVVGARKPERLIVRPRCNAALTVGLDTGISETTSSSYLGLTIQQYPDGRQLAFMGGIAIRPF